MLRASERRNPLNDRGEGRKGHRQSVQRRADHGAGSYHRRPRGCRPARLPCDRRGGGMAAAFVDYPRAAAVGGVAPKGRIYERAGVGTALRDLFVTEVDQITWKYKLAPETMNLAATRAVGESRV